MVEKRVEKLHKVESKGRLDFSILEFMDDMVRVIDTSGMVIYANEKMKRFCPESPVGKSCFTAGPEEMPRCISLSTFVTENAIMSEQRMNGHAFSVKSSPITDDDGEIIAAVEVFRDITIQNNVTSELFNANRKMTDDIHLARSIQSGMLPRTKSFGGIRFNYRYIPSGQLSGDIFDVIPIDENRLGVYIADVVGHGVSASIMTMFVRQTMRSILGEGKFSGPSEVLNELKERYFEIDLGDEQYFSMFYALIDIAQNELVYANAGHNCAPIVFRNGQYEYLETTGKLISNAFPKAQYQEHKLPLMTGNSFLFYTDGVVETTDRNQNEYGTENIISVIENYHGDLLGSIINDLKSYRWGEQKDDVALLLMETPQEL